MDTAGSRMGVPCLLLLLGLLHIAASTPVIYRQALQGRLPQHQNGYPLLKSPMEEDQYNSEPDFYAMLRKQLSMDDEDGNRENNVFVNRDVQYNRNYGYSQK